jgi:hypothetical protein
LSLVNPFHLDALGLLSLSQAFEGRHFGNSKNRQTTGIADATDGPRPLLIRLYPHYRGRKFVAHCKDSFAPGILRLARRPGNKSFACETPAYVGYGAAGAKRPESFILRTSSISFAPFLCLVGTIFCEPSVLSVQSAALGEQVRAITVEALGRMRKIDGSYRVSMHKHSS